MAEYRVKTVDLSTRMQIAAALLLPRPMRSWGWVSNMARQLGVSRTLLYRWRDQIMATAQEALAPRSAGPKPTSKEVVVDGDFIRYAIVVLSLVKGSLRDIQQALVWLFGVHRSIGSIHQVLQEAGAQALHYHQHVAVPAAVLGEADEIFQRRHPHLTVVDGRTFLVLHLGRAEARDATTWSLVLLDLQARGVQFIDMACDGARGLRQGIREAGLAIPIRADLFHLLREAHKISRRLERQAYKAIRTAERARRAEREARAPKRRRGPRLKVKVPLPQAEAQEREAIDRYDTWQWLLQEVRQALEPIEADGRLTSAIKARETLAAAASQWVMISALPASGLPKMRAMAWGSGARAKQRCRTCT